MKTISKIATVLSLSASLFAAEKQIIGYYASWQWYDRAKLAAPKNLNLAKWSHINFAFMVPSQDGKIHGTDIWADPQVLFGDINHYDPTGANSKEITFTSMTKGYTATKDLEYNTNPIEVNTSRYTKGTGLIELAHKVGTKVMVSIGGWTESCNFTIVAADASKRATFASEAARISREWDLDGIDIDWEYPGYTPHMGTAADRVNYIKLLQQVRDSLNTTSLKTGKSYDLTAALPCDPAIVDNGIDVTSLNKILTRFNLMTYDFFGAFDPVTNHNSPLYANDYGNKNFNVNSCVEHFMNKGVAASKLNVGSGFYGRAFIGAKEIGGSHSGADGINWPGSDGMPMYYDIVAKLPQMTKKWDDKSMVPYAVFANGGLVSYEDEKSVGIKSDYINNKGLSGVIVWEMSGDVMPDGTTPLLNVIASKLRPSGSIAPSSSSVKPSSSSNSSSSTNTSSSNTSSSSISNSVDCSNAPAWTAKSYDWVAIDELVTYNGKLYSHKDWVNDVSPDLNAGWKIIGACIEEGQFIPTSTINSNTRNEIMTTWNISVNGFISGYSNQTIRQIKVTDLSGRLLITQNIMNNNWSVQLPKSNSQYLIHMVTYNGISKSFQIVRP